MNRYREDKQFIWRDITDALLLGSPDRVIYIKGKDNKIFVRTVKEFFSNEEDLFDYFWLPLSEKKYLFKNIHSSMFNFYGVSSRSNRNYDRNDRDCFSEGGFVYDNLWRERGFCSKQCKVQ